MVDVWVFGMCYKINNWMKNRMVKMMMSGWIFFYFLCVVLMIGYEINLSVIFVEMLDVKGMVRMIRNVGNVLFIFF